MKRTVRAWAAAVALAALLPGCGGGAGSGPAPGGSSFETGVRANTLRAGQVTVVPIQRNKATTTLNGFREGVLLATFMGDNDDHQLRYAASLTQGGGGATDSVRAFGGETSRSVKTVVLSQRTRTRTVIDGALAARARQLARTRPARGRVATRLESVPALGEQQHFYVLEKATDDKGAEQFKRVRYPARLKAIAPHTYFYVDERYLGEDGSMPFAADFDSLVKYFEEVAIPTDTKHFGKLPGPPNDVDGEARVTVLITKMYQGALGYYGRTDAFDEPESNKRDMFYVGADVLKDKDGVDTLKATLIHELVHMIVDNHKRLLPTMTGGFPLWEEIFVNEGMAVVAEQLGGYGLPAKEGSCVSYVWEFLTKNPSAQLTASEYKDYLYGSGYLFMLYLMEQYGTDVFAKLVQSNKVGIENIERVTGKAFQDLFRDWAIALVASGHSDDPRHNFKTVDLKGDINGYSFDHLRAQQFNEFPVIENVTARPFSIIPIRFSSTTPGGTFNLSFTGSNWAGLQATLLDTSTLLEPATGKP